MKMNEYRVDVRPERYMLYIEHNDVPGMIGQVGSILGNHQINIGTMQVGRAEAGGEAIMVLTLDKQVGDDVAQELVKMDGLRAVQFLELPNGNVPVYNA